MPWDVLFDKHFAAEFASLDEAVQDGIAAYATAYAKRVQCLAALSPIR